MPRGAFYTMATLPVDDSDKFCAWILSEFNYHGETVMMAPGEGFYCTPGLGRQEVRIAYVLKIEDLAKALIILEEEASNFRLDRDIVDLLSHNIAVLRPLVAMY